MGRVGTFWDAPPFAFFFFSGKRRCARDFNVLISR
nr:MAG TPA: hypothetical protein [Caudoviricetes sp.]DAT91585.1 MAG TPA: hypothetical protein [Caudoviricetes sp.]